MIKRERRYYRRLFWLIGVIGLAAVLFLSTGPFKPYKDKSNAFVILTANQLDEIAYYLEFYQVKYGKYPDSLIQLKELDRSLSISDPYSRKKGPKGIFYYKSVDSANYVLFSVGKDGMLNTPDDIYPRRPIRY